MNRTINQSSFSSSLRKIVTLKDPPVDFKKFKSEYTQNSNILTTTSSRYPIVIEKVLENWKLFALEKRHCTIQDLILNGENKEELIVVQFSSNEIFKGSVMEKKEVQTSLIELCNHISKNQNELLSLQKQNLYQEKSKKSSKQKETNQSTPNLNLYLAQYPIWTKQKETNTNNEKTLSPFSHLYSQLEIPSFLPKNKIETINLWISCGFTKSNLHYDMQDNLLCVLRGVKQVKLIPPSSTNSLKPCSIFSENSNHSTLIEPPENLSSDLIFETTLTEGQCLFIPEGWWHQVTSGPELTVAVNFWWSSFGDKLGKERIDDEFYFTRLLCEQIVEREKQKFLEKNFATPLVSVNFEESSILEKASGLLLDFSSDVNEQHRNRLLFQISFDQLRKLLEFTSKKTTEKWKSCVFSFSPTTVQILTNRFEKMETESEMDLEESIYSLIFNDQNRNDLISNWVQKRKQFSLQIWNSIAKDVLAIDQ